jgi:hypothetical protein
LDSPFFFEDTTYWSEGDERAQFDWLSRIACIREVRGAGDRLFLAIDRASVTASDARELDAIYRRYGGNLEQLKTLQESINAQD